MHDVRQAIEVLGAAPGLDNLEFDPNGNLTPATDDNLLTNLHQQDAKTIEVWTALRSTRANDDNSKLLGSNVPKAP